MLTANNVQQLEQIATAFAKHERIPLEYAERLIAITEKAPNDALLAIVQRRVKFAAVIAARVLRDRGVKLP